MATTYVPVANSTYLDWAGYRITDATTVASAYGFTDGAVSTDQGMNIALVLPRATDETALLSQDWGARQQTIQKLNAAGTLWSTYGADAAKYNAIVSELGSPSYNLEVLHNSVAQGNYVSSAESRTIWVAIKNSADFEKLFNTQLMYSKSADLVYWNGGLSLPQGWSIAGLWGDYSTAPNGTKFAGTTATTLPLGAQGIGDSVPGDTAHKPQDIAALYNFPLVSKTVPTGAIGLIEPGIGDALPASQTKSFQTLLTEYLTTMGVSGSGTVTVQGRDGQSYSDGSPGERSLDVGVVAAVNPNSDLHLYNGSGYNGNAWASIYTAVQSSIWDTAAAVVGNTTAKTAVTSNSFGDSQSMSPGSPFYRAYWELFVDAVLANQTTVIALGDGGSGNQTSNGLTNVEYNVTQPWNLLVGGSSLSTTQAASKDPTLSTIYNQALAANQATIWQLVAGGLTSLPTNAVSTQPFLESVWNTYYVQTNKSGNLEITGIPDSGYSASYQSNSTGSGGVDVTQPTPSYQVDYGIHPVTSDPQHLTGRGAPDVSATAGGNMTYVAPNSDMVGTGGNSGTSAAAPLWASLIVQIDAVFKDQNLPNLGYMNDMLYTASAIAPASFNDVSYGNNTSSYFVGGSYLSGGQLISPTGYGYAAAKGYDLATGLGSPNGLLLARTLTAIAHSEMSFGSKVPDVLASTSGGWTSAANQSLLVETISDTALGVAVTAGASSLALLSNGTAAFAWDARVAGQSEQSSFDPALAMMFDRQVQGALGQVSLLTGDKVAVAIQGADATAVTANLTNQFGFIDFQTGEGTVRLARPVAVAETVNGLDGQTAIVRIRQDGADSLSTTFYRTDDFNGVINGIKPGDAGYAAAAQARAYETGTGSTSVAGPGFGQFSQTTLNHVNAGDIIAMKLVDTTQGKTYWAFSQANEVVNGQNVGHIWNYGLNTWGWEDTFGGGDRDYNDLVVGIDFTSSYGHAWLA